MLFKNINSLDRLLSTLEILVKRKKIVLALYPDKRVQQKHLAEITGLKTSNLSRYLKELEKYGLVIIKTGTTDEKFSANFIQLNLKTLQTLEKANEILDKPDKKQLPDKTVFTKILEGLLNQGTCEKAADGIQFFSRKYLIPYDAEFFNFINENWKNSFLQERLRVLIKSCRSMVQEFSDEDKTKVLNLVGSKLQKVIKKKGSSGLRTETQGFLKELGVYNLPYETLRDLYLESIEGDQDPRLFREILISDHQDRIMDLWLSLMEGYASASSEKKSRYDDEFSLIR